MQPFRSTERDVRTSLALGITVIYITNSLAQLIDLGITFMITESMHARPSIDCSNQLNRAPVMYMLFTQSYSF